MPTQEEKLEVLNDIVRNRGYVLDFYRFLVEYDMEVLQVIDKVAKTVYKRDRILDDKTKELLFVLSMTCLKVPQSHIAAHIKLALAAGASPQEVLEAIELAIPEAGVPAFAHGLRAWVQAVDAEALEPTVEGYQGYDEAH